MKGELVTTSLNKSVTRLNKIPLQKIILAHEITNIRVKTRYHYEEFREILNQHVGDNIEKLEDN